MNPPRILIVEDEGIVALDIQDRLARSGYQLAGRATSGQQALALAEEQRPSLVLMHVRLQGSMDGTAAEKRFDPIVPDSADKEILLVPELKLPTPILHRARYGDASKPSEGRSPPSKIPCLSFPLA